MKQNKKTASKNAFKLSNIGLAVLTFTSLQVMATHAVDNIETITITGHNDLELIEQKLSVRANPSPDMREQFNQLPGVNVNSNGVISGILQVRGMLGERVRVDVNGAEVVGAGPNGMDPPLSHLMSVSNQKVTFYRGIAPVSAGAEVLGGAFSIDDFGIDFNDSSTWQHSGGIMLNLASNNVKSLGALWHGSNDNAYITLSADHQTGDNYKAGDGREVPSTFYERQALKVRGGMYYGAHRFDALISHRDTNEAGTPALNMDILFVDATWFRFQHTYTASDDWLWQTLVFGNTNTHDMDNHTLRMPPPASRYRLNQTKADAQGLKSTISLDTSNGQLDIGVMFSQRAHDSYISNPNNAMFFIDNFDNVRRERRSVFVEHQQVIGESELRFGVRATEVGFDADSIGSNMAMMNPNVAALQNAFNQSKRDANFALVDVVTHWHAPVNNQWTMLASAGIKQRAPTYSELYTWFPLGISGGLADGNNYIGNLSLTPETAKKLDLGLSFQGQKSALTTHVFYDRVDNYIVGQTSTVVAANNIAMMNNIPLPLQWQNSDAILKGVELEARYTLSEQWQIAGVAEYVRGIQLGQADKDLYRIAPLNLRLDLQYQTAQWQWQFATQFVASQDSVASLQNETATDSYTLVHSNLSYVINKELSLSMSVHNLLDEHYAPHLGSVNRVMGADIARGERVPGAGRTFAFTATYEF